MALQNERVLAGESAPSPLPRELDEDDPVLDSSSDDDDDLYIWEHFHVVMGDESAADDERESKGQNSARSWEPLAVNEKKSREAGMVIFDSLKRLDPRL